VPGEWGISRRGPFRGEEFDLVGVERGKLNRKCRVSNDFFLASKSLRAINTCLDLDGRVQRER